MSTRRDIIKTALGAAAAMALPGASDEAVAKMAATLEAPVAPKLVGWSVGQHDRMNWRPVFAATKEQAIEEWAHVNWGGVECDECGRNVLTGEGGDPALYDDCCGDIGVHRSKHFDAHFALYQKTDDVPDIAKHHDGWCNIDCDRCGRSSDETTSQDVNHDVGGMLICEDCMTYADWRIADPDYADELLADYLDSEYGPEVML